MAQGVFYFCWPIVAAVSCDSDSKTIDLRHQTEERERPEKAGGEEQIEHKMEKSELQSEVEEG